MREPIYLDCNASTPLAPEVSGVMRRLHSCFGNPSSVHRYGIEARASVETARRQAAALLDCSLSEIVFTSGGTESNNHGITGAALACSSRGRHLITSSIEHPAVGMVCRHLGEFGWDVTVLPVDSTGIVDPDDLRRAMTPSTVLVSVMHANNETGTVQPVRELAGIAREGGALFHTDAAQSAGKIPVSGTCADLVSLAGHKFYGPKGTGILYVRDGVRPANLMHGAGHEGGRRPGTENVPGIGGLGEACRLAVSLLEGTAQTMRNTRDRLFERISELLGDDRIRLNGHPERRLPNTLSLSFRGVRADILQASLRDSVAVSAGAACHGSGISLSPVLDAMGIPPEWAEGTIRFSTGRYTTVEEVETAADTVAEAVLRLDGAGGTCR